MRRSTHALSLAALVSLAVAFPIGCSDVGDNSSGPGVTDAGNELDATNAGDVQLSDDSTGVEPQEAATGAGNDSAVEVEAASDDGASPVEPDDTGASPPPEAGPADTGSTEAATAEAGGPDAAAEEAGAPEAGASEAGGSDGNAPDANAPEAGTVDAGSHDAGQDATVTNDSGVPDAGVTGTDAGHTDGGALLPCTQLSGSTPADSTGNAACVQCANNAAGNGVCTATEALIVARDIAQGNVDAATHQLNPYTASPGHDTLAEQGSCYGCLNFKSCLDDNNGDTNQECGDANDLAGAAAGSGVGLCLATLSCILSTDCQGAGGIAGYSADTTAQENINLCYCGGNNVGSACKTAGAAVDGLCVAEEVAGFGFMKSDNASILNNFSASPTYPSGVVNAMFTCASAQKCTICE